MEFRIADTLTDSLAKLNGEEQKAVKTTAFDLQLNPAHPALQFHKLDQAKDPHFWAVRVSLDIRLIVHRTEAGLLLCYVDHHDSASRFSIARGRNQGGGRLAGGKGQGRRRAARSRRLRSLPGGDEQSQRRSRARGASCQRSRR
jgi:mRNA-degrading endonuclease RelE of RelBE toxin-antitoxin system